MDYIYEPAVDNAPPGKKPIFLVNIAYYKVSRFGNSSKVRKTFEKAKKIVCSGTKEEIKKSDRVLLQCLIQLLGKQAAFKAEKKNYFIDEVDIISFHGYTNN